MQYSVCTAVIGAEKNAIFIDKLLHLYDGLHFFKEQKADRTPNSQRIFEYLNVEYDYKDSDSPIVLNDCTIYPKDYFSPLNCYTFKEEITDNTYCIHHFAGTWKNKNELCLNRVKAFITRIIGEDCRNSLKKRVMKGK